jgi:hypothetical protein
MEDREGVGVCANFTDCGISEMQFPHIGKCCMVRRGMFRAEYDCVCPYCTAMAFPASSLSLEIMTFFECSRLGYFRRTTDAQILKTDSGPEIPKN